jgi:PAS domain S-box-containing protein
MRIHIASPYTLLTSSAFIIPALLFFLIIWQDYNSIIGNAKTDAVRTAKIFEQHALNVFETHQLVAERINDRLKDMSWDQIGHSKEIQSYLAEIEKEYPQVFAIWLADSSGTVRNASKQLPEIPINVSDRDYFQALSKKNASNYFIGNIVKPRVIKSLNFNFAFRRQGKGSTFDGVVVVTADPEYFSKFWNSVTSRKDSAAVLLRSDGSILSRSLGLDPSRLLLPADSQPMKHIRTAHEGTYISESVHTGVERVFGFQKIDRYNAFIIYGISLSSVLQKWHEHILIYGACFGIAMAILILFAVSAKKYAQRIQSSEQALRESEQIYRAIGESIQYGIWVCDAEGRNLYASDSFLKLVGITQQQCSDFGWGDILHPDDADATIASWKKCVETEGNWDVEHRFRGADGQWHPILARGVPVRNSNGRITNWVGINLDISRSKQAEEKLLKLNEELDQLVEERTLELREKTLLLIQQNRLAAMGEMIQNIAHQWRQPLNTLGLKIQSLPFFVNEDKVDKDLLDKTVSSAMSLIMHMSGTIDDFRNFFRPDKEKEEYRVNQIVESAIKLIEGSFKSSNITISMSFQDDPVVCGYPNEYSQAILNILINAKDALLANKTDCPLVTIYSHIEAGKSVITIGDNAGGIPEEIIFKIFDPHFTTKGPQGTGIGLFMAKTIIEHSMNGKLTVCNNAEGAVFRIEV